MTEIVDPIDMLEPIEDVGGAAQPLLQVDGLTKHFPVRGDLFGKRKTVRAVDDVSFSIAKGETLGIVGESGCGKSTTARLLMHLMPRDAGEIIYRRPAGRRARCRLRELRRGMQMVFQDSYASLNPRLTIEESIAFGPKVHGMADDGRARAGARAARQGRACGRKTSPTAIRTRFPAASASASTSPARWRCRRGW